MHLLTRLQAADYLRAQHNVAYAPSYLAKLASTGGGPRFVKVGRWPRYATADLDAWIASITVTPELNTEDDPCPANAGSVERA